MSERERFWAKVDTRGLDDCWVWGGKKDSKGYGRFYLAQPNPLNRRTGFAHRMAWTLTHGEIPQGMFVCHHCDNPPCVNPAHLFLGTQQDNMADCGAKGRLRTGPRSGMAAEIVQRHRAGVPQAQLAKQYGIPKQTVNAIVLGRKYGRFTGVERVPRVPREGSRV